LAPLPPLEEALKKKLWEDYNTLSKIRPPDEGVKRRIEYIGSIFNRARPQWVKSRETGQYTVVIIEDKAEDPRIFDYGNQT
jgi:hypothetical protein